jgi:RNA polymerase sigma factor (sigma-70 family)
MPQEIDKDLIDSVIHNKLEAIFGFSMKRTEDRTDAEDLTQDILIEVYRSYTKLKYYEGPEALEGWIWSIARHTYCRWLNNRKKNPVVYIEGTLGINHFNDADLGIDDALAHQEQLNLLRKEISLLSKNYRDIIVLFYLENKTLSEIAEIAELSLSTVKWRLHEAKRIIKERMENMKNYTERSYAPGNLWVNSAGNFSTPYSANYVYNLLKSLLRQNLILGCYREPLSLPEISVELGIPRAYLEEDIDHLVEEELLREVTLGKYQTNFVIITKDMKEKLNPLLENIGDKIATDILELLTQQENIIRNIKFIGSDKPWEELLWLLVPFCANHFKRIPNEFDLPLRPHGNSWILLGYEGVRKDYPWSGAENTSVSLNGTFAHVIYWTNKLTFRANNLNEREARFYKDCVNGKINLNQLDKNSEQEELAAQLINRGFLVKCGTEINLNLITFREEQFEIFTKVIDLILQSYDPHYVNMIHELILNELKKSVPLQLQKDLGPYALLLLSDLVGYIMKALLDRNLLQLPASLETSTKGMYVEIRTPKHS